jgi:SAM-dependent methyltransferase
MEKITGALHLNPYHFRILLENLGPSLGLWRAAEIAALREQEFIHPVLDLGCGDGMVTSMVLPRVEIGLDPDQKELAKAARLGIYQQFEALPVEDTRLPDECVATILSNSVLEHLPDIDAALRSAARLLRPGGRLILTTPNAAFSRWLLLPLGGYARWRNQKLQHLNIWPVETWAEHLRRAGLQVECYRPYLRHSLVTTWDALELAQLIWVGRRRLVGMLWRNLSPRALDQLSQRYASLDLSAEGQGGGQLIIARKI